VRVDPDVAIQLDLPQLVGEPPREVPRSAGMNAAFARGQIPRGMHPDTWFGPLEAAEGPRATGSQELVGDHWPARFFERKAFRAAAGGSGEAGPWSCCSATIVAFICSA